MKLKTSTELDRNPALHAARRLNRWLMAAILVVVAALLFTANAYRNAGLKAQALEQFITTHKFIP